MSIAEPQAAAPDAARRELPMIISVDDHLVEPAHLWQEWLPAKFKARGPRIERRRVGDIRYTGGASNAGYEYALDDPDAPWGDVWFYEDLVHPNKRHVAAVGFARDEMTAVPITYDEMRPGCYEPKARVDDMLANHVEASLSFPTFPRFCGQTFAEAKDKELALACVKAYNDFMIEEWCGDSDGALIPLQIIPLWDVGLAVEELKRNRERGCKAMCFSEIPAKLGLPSIHSGYWDPMFEICAELGIVVNMHIGSSSQMPATSPDAPVGVAATLSFNNAMASMSDFLFSGLLVRYPKLKLAYSEGQMGWVPYILERADDVWREHRAWANTQAVVKEPPSTYYYQSIYTCFFRDNHGLASLDVIGEDNVTFETDYPHTDTTWPDTLQVATEMMGHLSDELVHKLVRGNAARLFDLDIEPFSG